MNRPEKLNIILIDADKEDNNQNRENFFNLSNLCFQSKENNDKKTQEASDLSSRYYDHVSRNSFCLDEEDSSSNMSITPDFSESNITKNFPEFFNNEPVANSRQSVEEVLQHEKQNELNQLKQTNEENQEKIPGILERSRPKNSEYDDFDDNLSTFDQEDSICSENEDPNEFRGTSLESIKNRLKTDNRLSLIDEFLTNQRIMDENAAQITDQQTIDLDKIYEMISATNEIEKTLVENIIKMYLNGSTPVYISRYGQHFNWFSNTDLINRIITDFERLRNVNNLKYFKRLSLLKNRRFNSFGKQLLDQCMTYTSLAKVYFLYYELTESTTSINNELSTDILNGRQNLESIKEKASSDLAANEQLLYEGIIKMVGDFLSKDDQVINYLFNSELRPKLRVKISLKKKSVVDKYIKYVKMNEIDINEISPVDALEIIQAEEANLIKMRFNFIEIETKLLDFLTDLYPNVNPEFLKDVFNFTWNYYFKSNLVCYHIYEMKKLSKQLLVDDFQRKLKPMLNRSPVLNQHVLVIEPKASLFSEGIQYGIQINSCRLINKYIDLKQTPFKSFFVDLFRKYQFTTLLIGLPPAYLSFKIRDLIFECMNFREISPYRNKIRVLMFPKTNALIDDCDLYARINYYMDEIVDPLRFFAHFSDHIIVPDYKYFDLVKPYIQDVLNGLLRQCFSYVPVDVNFDSLSTLKYVNGLNEDLAKRIIKYREEKGPFINREQLKRVEGMTNEIYTQCAGFLNINPKTIKNFKENIEFFNIYDCTMIHPDFYEDADNILNFISISKKQLGEKQVMEMCKKFLCKEMSMQSVSQHLGIDIIKTKIIFEAILRPLNFDCRIKLN